MGEYGVLGKNYKKHTDGSNITKSSYVVKRESVNNWSSNTSVEDCLRSLSQTLIADERTHIANMTIIGHGIGQLTWFLYSSRNYGWLEFKSFTGEIIWILSINDGTATYKIIDRWN